MIVVSGVMPELAQRRRSASSATALEYSSLSPECAFQRNALGIWPASYAAGSVSTSTSFTLRSPVCLAIQATSVVISATVLVMKIRSTRSMVFLPSLAYCTFLCALASNIFAAFCLERLVAWRCFLGDATWRYDLRHILGVALRGP